MLYKDFVREHKDLLRKNPQLGETEVISFDATGKMILVPGDLPIFGEYDKETGKFIELGVGNERVNVVVIA